MAKIRIGLIGSGGMASHRAAQFARLATCELRVIAARNPDTGPTLARQYQVPLCPDWRDLIAREEVDAVVICTHNESHGRMAIAALEAGKHVFIEYPLAASMQEARQLMALSCSSGQVLRVAHEPVAPSLRQQVASLGPLLEAVFVRLTPGRGAQPDILFNLNISGPPVLFFIYHIYPLVDLFGPAGWVAAGAHYTGLQENGRYQRFVNTVSAGFVRGGLGQWTWAGGIEISGAEEYQRLVLEKGTLVRRDSQWQISTTRGVEELVPERGEEPGLEARFIDELGGQETGWQEDTRKAFEAVLLSLAAATSMQEGRRVEVDSA